jgi:hypothetical protein
MDAGQHCYWLSPTQLQDVGAFLAGEKYSLRAIVESRYLSDFFSVLLP